MSTTALLVMDVQQGIMSRYAADAEYLPRLRRAIEAARTAGIRVIYVTVAFREGHPEISERNKSFSAIGRTSGFTAGDAGTTVYSAVAPAPGEPVVIKRRVSAFAGSDLDVLLREETGLPVSIAEDPLASVVIGTGKMLTDFNLLRRVALE